MKRFIATQYFFEGHGNMTTLTRAEGSQYTNKLRALAEASPEALPAKEIVQDKQETSQERFERLMKKSEELLQKSNLLLEESK